MATSYTRQSSFSDGDTITAALFNNEYNQLLNAFAYASSGTTGHRHDGTAAEGGNIHTVGDQDFLNKIKDNKLKLEIIKIKQFLVEFDITKKW